MATQKNYWWESFEYFSFYLRCLLIITPFWMRRGRLKMWLEGLHPKLMLKYWNSSFFFSLSLSLSSSSSSSSSISLSFLLSFFFYKIGFSIPWQFLFFSRKLLSFRTTFFSIFVCPSRCNRWQFVRSTNNNIIQMASGWCCTRNTEPLHFKLKFTFDFEATLLSLQ